MCARRGVDLQVPDGYALHVVHRWSIIQLLWVRGEHGRSCSLRCFGSPTDRLSPCSRDRGPAEVLFTCLTLNPAALHLDAEAARDTEFGQRLINSMFTQVRQRD